MPLKPIGPSKSTPASRIGLPSWSFTRTLIDQLMSSSGLSPPDRSMISSTSRISPSSGASSSMVRLRDCRLSKVACSS